MNMTPEKMKMLALDNDSVSFTNQELKDQIQALRLVTSYLENDKHCRLVWIYLYDRLQQFEGFAESRKR